MKNLFSTMVIIFLFFHFVFGQSSYLVNTKSENMLRFKKTQYDIKKVGEELSFQPLMVNGCKLQESASGPSKTEVRSFTKEVELTTITNNTEDFQNRGFEISEAIVIMGVLSKTQEIYKKERYVLIPIQYSLCFEKRYLVMYCFGKKTRAVFMPTYPTIMREGDYIILKK